jgi:integrase
LTALGQTLICAGLALGRMVRFSRPETKVTDDNRSLKKAGRYADGANLYVTVSDAGAKRWTFLYRSPASGKQRETSFGGINDLTLAQARERAREGRVMLREGKDPIEAWREMKRAAQPVLTFREAAEAHFAKKLAEWKNQRSGKGERSLLYRHGSKLMDVAVDKIDTAAVLGVLKPTWTELPDMSRRLRAGIEQILNVGFVMTGLDRANPARWKGHLDHLLPKSRKPVNHAAMPYFDVPGFVGQLREVDTVYAHALEVLILTATRANETLQMRWTEIDFGARVWTIPPTRMKSGREHRVPLSDRAIGILRHRREAAPESEMPFRGKYCGLNNKGLERLLAKLGGGCCTVHGYRSAFRDWCGEETNFPRELAEAALAHVVGEAVERAYRRGDALEKRRALMDAWARYLDGDRGGEVVPFRQIENAS